MTPMGYLALASVALLCSPAYAADASAPDAATSSANTSPAKPAASPPADAPKFARPADQVGPAAPQVLCYRAFWFGPAVIPVGDEQMLVPSGGIAARMAMSDGSEQMLYFAAAIKLAACKGAN